MKLENRYTIDPLKIVVDFKKLVDSGGNPRETTNYGTPEDWEEFKDSIAINGLRQNIKVFLNGKGQYCLRHGYRRLKAVRELIKEDRWSGDIPYDSVSEDPIEGLIDHFVMNTGRPLTDLEKGKALVQLSKLTGKTKTSELAKMVSMRVQKVAKLMTFMERAEPDIVEKLAADEMSFDTAYQMVTKAKSSRDQLKMLKEGVKGMKADGGKKILQKHLLPIRKTMDFNTQLGLLITDAHHKKSTDFAFLNRLQKLINLIKEQAPYPEQIEVFKNEGI